MRVQEYADFDTRRDSLLKRIFTPAWARSRLNFGPRFALRTIRCAEVGAAE